MNGRIVNGRELSLFTIHDLPFDILLSPFEGAFAPRVVITDYQNSDEDEHLDQRKLREREIVAHEDDRPGQQKDRLNVENQKQHRDDVEPHGEAIVRAGFRIDAALVRPHLVLFDTCKAAGTGRGRWAAPER